MRLHSKDQHEMQLSCVWAKRDVFFIVMFSECPLEKLYCSCSLNKFNSRCLVFLEFLVCVAHLLLMSSAHTCHILMLMSWSPGDGSGTPRESSTKLRKKSTIRDANEKNWIPHGYTRFDSCSAELLKALLFGINGVAFHKYVMNALTRMEAEEGGTLAGPYGVRGWRQSRHEPVWRHEAPSDAHRHAEG